MGHDTNSSSSTRSRFTTLVALSVLGGTFLVITLDARNEPAREESPPDLDVAAFFAHLTGSSWEIRGEWVGGGAFHQVKELAWGLDGRIVKVRTFVPDPTGEGFVLRSEGIRAPDRTTGGWRFFEFDRDGGIAYGPIGRTETTLHYEYEYFVDGEIRTLRDAWIRTREAGFVYQVGIWEDEGWEKVLLTAEARPITPGSGPFADRPDDEPPATDTTPEAEREDAESVTDGR